MSLLAWLPRSAEGEFERELRARLGPNVELVIDEAAPVPPDQEVLVSGRPTEEQLDASPRLRAVVIPWAGVPPVTLQRVRARPGVSLHVLHHNAAPTAELAVTLMLAVAKRVVPYDRALRAGDWRPRWEETGGALIAGRTALVLGLGAIGRRVARTCLALDMSVLATRRRPGEADRHEWPDVEVHPSSATLDLLPRADVVLCCLPETAQTRGLLDEDALARLPRGAILVNVARGPIVCEDALWGALTSGQLGGAGLDTWWSYPQDEDSRSRTPPSRHPLGELDSVVLSPHRAGHSDATARLRAEHLAATLAAAAAGEPLPNEVDLEAGY